MARNPERTKTALGAMVIPLMTMASFLKFIAAMAIVAGGVGVATAQDRSFPLEATTADGEIVLLMEDGKWIGQAPDSEVGQGAASAEPEEDVAPAALSLGELIATARERQGDIIAVEGRMTCFSEQNCDIVSDQDAFYTRENVSVTIDLLDRADRQALLGNCGRFDPRCPVTVVGTVDFSRYDALFIRAQSVDALN